MSVNKRSDGTKKPSSRKTIEGYKPQGLDPWIEGGPFSDAVIDELLSQVGYPLVPFVNVAHPDIWEELRHKDRSYQEEVTIAGRDLFKHWLFMVGQRVSLLKEERRRPNEWRMSEQHRSISQGAARMLRLLGVPGGDFAQFPHAFGEAPALAWTASRELRDAQRSENVTAILRSTVSGLELIRRAAEVSAEEYARAAAALGETDPSRISSTPEANLVEGLIEVWRICFGRSDINKKRFRSFVAAVGAHLGMTFEDEALKKRIMRLGRDDDGEWPDDIEWLKRESGQG